MKELKNKSYKINFGKNADGHDWEIVNDDVMGGMSKSSIILTDNSLLFKGILSLENNGGFASIRSCNTNFDFSNFKDVTIKFKSTDRNFAFRLAQAGSHSKLNYKHYFSSLASDWKIGKLKLTEFKKYNRGEVLSINTNNHELTNIIRVGIILNDKKEGPFKIEIDTIEFS